MIQREQVEKANVFGITIDAVNMPTAVSRVFDALHRPPSFVCLAGAHGIVEARRNVKLALAYREAALVLPDGMPAVWIGRAQGFKRMDRVFGPDLMLEVIAASEKSGESHFLLGGKPGVCLDLQSVLQRRFPGARIVGTYTPPFRELTKHEEMTLRSQLQACRPDFIWIGLSTPKQEIFMRRYRNVLSASVMIGVGAAFDFHTGRISDSPAWAKRAGLQWLHRLLQEPRRLWKRYLRTNSIFLGLVALHILGFERTRTLPMGTACAGSTEEPVVE